ncbi:DegT/DnrJ/EryC1/StrS family aminotransferase [Xylophilus ampelinus]|uniref:dTDP-4-amino-4,6-dideoxygalactose transaminase n=1 Tax=Xylophilus ampelinus TaxID=54067 RepID=A0A318SEC2_9BURK|nr:DegT/DnrJ/EryC1/StrS family aminotransferase [Xylophilus ampelinus]MCS4511209.1 DegT/DnrJ/EryC1/StrS family aminotransferase [Xylophilus ampelinus]PYE75036.1 dTDP-4-amino-4,6-dideoxygalactose transaminase [Xylophilus ampelinus]
MRPVSAIPLLVPDMPAPEVLVPYLARIHASRHYSNFGPLVCELEARLAERFQAPGGPSVSVTTVSNATLGLELALATVDRPRPLRVLLPALTFVATATAVLRIGHVPVIADVDPHTWLLTPDIAQETLRTTPFDVVMPVASFGAPQDMRGWNRFEQAHGVPVIVDAAGAYGSQWLAGSTGTAVFSLHATKSLPAGEGGFVVSTDAALVHKVRQLSNFGINLDPDSDMPVGCLASVGTNAKMSEFHAAVALASLEVWEERAALRGKLHASQRAELNAACGGLLRWQALAQPQAAPTMLCVRLPSAALRAEVEARCAAAGVGTRQWYQPLLGTMLAITERCVLLPTATADDIAADMLGLPFYPGMREELNQKIVGLMASVVNP